MTSLAAPSARLNTTGIAGSALGLVPSSTSDTLAPVGAPTASAEPVEIISKESRLRRMAKAVKTSARLHEQECSASGYRYFMAMVTLTYAPTSDPDKRDISSFLKRIREWCRRRRIAFRYVWVLELHKSGRPHYHVLIWLPRGYRLPKPDKRGWWPHGMSKIEGARKPVGYLAKYASKLVHEAQGDSHAQFNSLPKGARIHGAGGLSEASRLERRWWLSPKWVRDVWAILEDPRPCPGGGYVSRVLGDWLPSPWRVEITSDRRVFARYVGWSA